jgi:hypothetical protein
LQANQPVCPSSKDNIASGSERGLDLVLMGTTISLISAAYLPDWQLLFLSLENAQQCLDLFFCRLVKVIADSFFDLGNTLVFTLCSVQSTSEELHQDTID